MDWFDEIYSVKAQWETQWVSLKIQENMEKYTYKPSKKCTNLTTTLSVKKNWKYAPKYAPIPKCSSCEKKPQDSFYWFTEYSIPIGMPACVFDSNWSPKLTSQIDSNYVLFLLPYSSLDFAHFSPGSLFRWKNIWKWVLSSSYKVLTRIKTKKQSKTRHTNQPPFHQN